MSLERGKFGIEYDPRHLKKESSGLGWLLVSVVILVLVLLTWTLVSRYRAARDEKSVVESISTTASAKPAAPSGAPEAEPPPSEPPVGTEKLRQRPPAVRNLLLRLEEAERRRDVEMAASTIESLRAMPTAADLDDALAHRLGTLNFIRLFAKKSRAWVKEVTVRRGDSATRIAKEHGSTLASLSRLNGGGEVKVILGRKLYVLDHPQATLVVHCAARQADLLLKGKFFKRYDLTGEVSGATGQYEFPSGGLRAFWNRLGVRLKDADRAELEMMLTNGDLVLVSET